jgi:hypothetical protein
LLASLAIAVYLPYRLLTLATPTQNLLPKQLRARKRMFPWKQMLSNRRLKRRKVVTTYLTNNSIRSYMRSMW